VKEKGDSDEVLNEEVEDSSWNGDTTAGHGSSFGTFCKFPLDDLTSQYHGEDVPTPASISLSNMSLTVQAELRMMKAPNRHLARPGT
jgi:hypothetical protein